ncbi:MAG: TIGR02757 family protein [Myxococcota bacterium]|nr:TIGR02757 family protein [Myxococcota bacterium]
MFDTLKLRQQLDEFIQTFDYASSRQLDPVRFVHRWPSGIDQEIVALYAALLAYGRADVLGRAIEEAVARMGAEPGLAITTDSTADAVHRFSGFVYRVTRGVDLARLWVGLGHVIRRWGSIGSALQDMDIHDSADLKPALNQLRDMLIQSTSSFEPRRGFHHFMPNPGGGSAIKRLNLWLRWMVRGPDVVDLGVWSFLGPERLVMPVDTHVHRIAQYLGLTDRTQSDWKTAVEITDALRRLDPQDPLKYDFALAHLGISGHCTRVQRPDICRDCDLRTICTLPTLDSIRRAQG